MEELRKKLVELCNESGLPLEALMFVVRDVYRDVSETYREMKEYEAQEAKKEKDEKED